MAKVDSKHEQYVKKLPIWEKCNDAVEGQEAVHSKADAYLPMLKEQAQEDYDSYKRRALFFNATGRTLDGLVGMVFRKDPILEGVESIDDYINDIDLSGTHLNSLASDILEEVLKADKVGVLVEFPVVEEKPKNKAEQAKSNLRPYVCKYTAQSIINWRSERINNVMQYTLIVLMEKYTTKDDGFELKQEDQIRALRLVDGVYIQEIYRKSTKGKQWELFDTIKPIIRNKSLNYIPFYVFGSKANTLDSQMPLLLDLVNVNMSHYMTTADYEAGCHIAGLPTPIVTGHNAETDDKFHIGPNVAWVFRNPDAKAYYLEFQGEGLTALETNLARKVDYMGAIGARMLEQQKNGVESEGAMQMRSNGENSVLGKAANMISKTLSDMLTVMAEWGGKTTNVSVQLNTDYYPVAMTPQKLTALFQSYVGGAISFDTFYENLIAGEVVSGERTAEEEQDLISQQQPELAQDGG